jgi:thiol-disulfide isomerase/thioredoxin
MKKNFIIFFMLLLGCSVFSQKIIDKPDYGMSSLPGNLTKIELASDATILHFHIKYEPGNWISILKASYIQDVKGGEKYAVIKTDSIPLETRYTIPKSGEVRYKLYFPRISTTVNKIDFIEGDWAIYDIVINETESSLLPKALQGNWLQVDGSNQWDYGFYNSNAIVNSAIWNYKSVENKKNNYTIVLEKNGIQKTIYAQLDKKGTVKFGENKEKLTTYSTEKTANPNYKLANDEVYSDIVFKSDSATYAGVIKDYTPRSGKKTGTIFVNNVFTGNQESYLIKIADDGSFSVKFPVANPQFVLARLAHINSYVFVEPSKETFHYINGDEFLFMGDCARINTDLRILKDTNPYKDYEKSRKNILVTNPQDYKNSCLEIQQKQLKALNDLAEKQFISQKAFQIKKMDIEFGSFYRILDYDMYKKSAKRSKSSSTNQKDNQPEQEFKLDNSYYDFIPKSILNDKLAVMSLDYYSFINRLNYEDFFRSGFVSNFSRSRIAVLLQKSGVILSNDELEMIAASKEVDKVSLKQQDFYQKNRSEIEAFKKNHKQAWDTTQKDNPTNFSIGDFGTYLTKQGITLTTEEKKLLADFKLVSYTKEEAIVIKKFSDKYGKIQQAYYEEYDSEINVVINDSFYQNADDKMKEVFGINEAFAFDVIALQRKVNHLDKNLMPYTDNQLKWIQGKIKHPFLSKYIVGENDRVKAKIEANKSKGGFTVNTVKKTEGDDLFESMISKFKGKVIYVDFWATWCGPCISGIKTIAPLKEEMKNQDVVFLYITGETSPLKTWENNVPNIKGEHYRVTNDEWNYLLQKFNISGIPHYVLVNKKGEVVNPKLGHHSNESLKEILEKQM